MYVAHTILGTTRQAWENVNGKVNTLWTGRDLASKVTRLGAIYYANTQGNLPIVTDAAIDNPVIMMTLQRGIDSLLLLLKEMELGAFPNMEIYITTLPAATECYYYLIDHGSQKEFWLHDTDMAALGMSPVSSRIHTKSILQEHYWTHVEYFPHRPVALRLRIELMDIFRHACTDQMTSDNSTFPYDSEQCSKFKNLIDIQNSETTTYMTCLVARIWVMISRHRYDHFYGEQCARLCRDQHVFDWPDVKLPIAVRIYSAVLFNFPKTMAKRFEDLYIDQILYKIHWDRFMRSMKQNWHENVLVCTGVLIANAALVGLGFTKNPQFMCSGGASMILSTSGLLSGCLLLHAYEQADQVNAATTTAHLQDVRYSDCGFGLIGVVFSLPKALMFWSILFLFFEMTITMGNLIHPVDTIVLAPMTILVVLSFAAIGSVLRRPSVAS
ncbi:hypothetical protein CERSUDRAFT_107036 [Gelatoporia subvermispora B]|uniref:Uncharacterized protein n=1 Tax=Ceriporiopsis subvermispora (strain B) TaxID=914234 RepID=M2R8H8_CERS8|nr:hypothetical protein CERSUDRAFT_107036 [Gelatoporia subvermispora B]